MCAKDTNKKVRFKSFIYFMILQQLKCLLFLWSFESIFADSKCLIVSIKFQSNDFSTAHLFSTFYCLFIFKMFKSTNILSKHFKRKFNFANADKNTWLMARIWAFFLLELSFFWFEEIIGYFLIVWIKAII